MKTIKANKQEKKKRKHVDKFSQSPANSSPPFEDKVGEASGQPLRKMVYALAKLQGETAS